MATYEYTLAPPPEEPRQRELWLQHAAGFILMENVRQAAIARLDPHLSPEAAIQAIDAAREELMSVIDGVSGGLRNSHYQVDLHMSVQLHSYATNQSSVLEQRDLREGDGMCLGIHGWRAGDYGAHPIVES
jgi:hypothetical protein